MTDTIAAARLAAFLSRSAAEPFVYGESDCSMFLANWVREVTGRDPAGELRRAYSDEPGWRSLVAEAGGLAVLVGRLALVAGLSPVATPGEARVGDIAVVGIPALGSGGWRFEAGAICSSFGPMGMPRWVTKLTRGISRLQSTPLAMWTFARPRAAQGKGEWREGDV